MSHNIIIAKEDYTSVSTTTVTGSGWEPLLDVDNLITSDLATLARAAGTTAVVTMDLGRARHFSVIAVPKHNLTSLASWRIRTSNDANLLTTPDIVGTVYDSNTVLATVSSSTSINLSTTSIAQSVTIIVSGNAWFTPGATVKVVSIADSNEYVVGTITNYSNATRQLTFSVVSKLGSSTFNSWNVQRLDSPSSIWPGFETFGSKVYGEFTWGGVVSLETGDANTPAILLLPDDLEPARYIHIEIDDSSNPLGYFDISKLVVAPVWRPSLNLELGWTIEYVDNSPITRSLSGAVFIDEVPRYRRIKFRLNHLGRDEMFGNLLELDKTFGKSSPVLVILDPTDSVNLHMLTVYGSQPTLGAITNALPNSYKKDITIEEWL